MLEGVLVITYIIIVVIGIGKERITRSKHITGREVRCRQLGLFRVLDDKKVLRVVAEVLAELIAQVRIGIAVTNNLLGLRTANRTVICSY